MKDFIIRNEISTPDGTHLHSTHQHHCITHRDKNGSTYGCDGGREYIRRIGPMDRKELSVWYSDGHMAVREAFRWGTYGKFADQPKKIIALKDLSCDHIKAILKTQAQLTDKIRRLFGDEQLFRLQNDITIGDTGYD